MSYVAKSLGPDETIIYQASIHWIVYLRPILVVLIGLGLGVLFVPALIIALVGLLWFAIAWIITHTIELAVTNRKVVAKSGFIARDTVEQRLEKVDSIAVDQTFWGRVLNFGDVTIHGAGVNQARPLKWISDPVLFRRQVDQAIEARMPHLGEPKKDTA